VSRGKFFDSPSPLSVPSISTVDGTGGDAMRAATLVAIVVSSVAAGTAHAQSPVFDHLQCFRIRSSATSPVPSTLGVDLQPEQVPPFTVAAGCRVKTKPRYLCIDVAKQNVRPAGWTLPVNGETARDYLCYDVKCPKPAGGLADDIVSDQFGEHAVTTGASSTLCVPAVPGPVPRPTAAPCNDAGGGQCSDTCSGGYQCRFVPAGFDLIGSPAVPIDIPGTNDCRCVPPNVACGNGQVSVCAVAGDDLLCSNSRDRCEPSTCTCEPGDCGGRICPTGTVCCNPLMQICTPPGVACIQ
jgi:hypothetical protein